MGEDVTIWTCKYALTDGAVSPQTARISGRYAYVGKTSWQFIMGQDAFLTAEEAGAQAEVMRDKKIASLEKQIARLQKLRFSAPES